MSDVHVAVFSTGEAITAAVFAALVLAGVGVVAWVVGHMAGARAERAEADRRAARDMDDTAAAFGPRPDPSHLWRIK